MGQGPAWGKLRSRPQEEELRKAVIVEGKKEETPWRYRAYLQILTYFVSTV